MLRRLKNKLAIIRALDLRIIQAEYSSSFNKFDTTFVANQNLDISKFLKSRKSKYEFIKLRKPYFIDPFKLFRRDTTHQSWLNFDQKGLEEALNDKDIYQIQEPFFLYSGQVAAIAKKNNKPLVMTPFTCFDHPSWFIAPYSINVSRSIDKTELFIMRSSRVNNYLSRFKVPDSKKVLIYHGVNLDRFHPNKGKSENKIKILFVGVLDNSKGLGDILDIFPKLIKSTSKKVELIVCGKGVLENKVKKMTKDLPIIYKGYVSNLDLPDIYRNADIFCGPSKDWHSFGIQRWEENFGFVFVEAMASGLPIVSTNSGAIKEIVGDDNLVINQGDLKGLKNSLLELINDPGLRLSTGKKNRIRCEQFFDIKKQIKEEEKEMYKHFC